MVYCLNLITLFIHMSSLSFSALFMMLYLQVWRSSVREVQCVLHEVVFAGVEKFSASFMGEKMDRMRIEVLAVEYPGGDTAVDNHRNITTKTTPEGSISVLSSK